MWPKAFAQLIELAPHVSRLLPMADRFLQNRSQTEEAGRKSVEALESVAEDLRGDLGEVFAANTSLGKQVEELSGKLAGIDTGIGAKVNALTEDLSLVSNHVDSIGKNVQTMSAAVNSLKTSLETATARIESVTADVRGARTSAETLEARFNKLEGTQGRLFLLLGLTLLLLVITVGLLAMLFMRAR